jgi:hypothetical protein
LFCEELYGKQAAPEVVHAFQHELSSVAQNLYSVMTEMDHGKRAGDTGATSKDNYVTNNIQPWWRGPHSAM